MKQKYIFLLLRVLISVGLIGYFVFTMAKKHGGVSEALTQFLNAFSSASVNWLIPVVLLYLVGYSLVSFRWLILLRAQGVKTTFKELFLFYFMAAFFNTFLPSTIGGDAVRAIESKKLMKNTTSSIMVVIIERLTGLMALVLIAATALVVRISRSQGSESAVFIFIGGVLAAFLLMIAGAHPKIAPKILNFTKKRLPTKIQSFLEQAYEAISVYYKKPMALLMAQLVSIIFQLCMVVYYLSIALALNQKPDIVEFMVNIPIMIFLLMTVPAINGLGIRTASFKELMRFPAAFALAGEMIDLGLRICFGLLGGVVFLFYRRGGSNNNENC
jgi:uncharacterized protein (TIRG00374 family)